MDSTIQKVIDALHKNHMQGYYAKDEPALLECMRRLVPFGSRVGSGDSATLEQTGVFRLLREGDFTFHDKHAPGIAAAEKRAVYLENFDADVFVTGVNAVTIDGKLFFIDGNGSRVAPILYGPRRVVVVAGKNKVVEDEAQACARARQVAAPLDAKRLKKETPCVKLGRCADCRHKDRICNSFVTVAGQFDKNRIHVVLLGFDAGF